MLKWYLMAYFLMGDVLYWFELLQWHYDSGYSQWDLVGANEHLGTDLILCVAVNQRCCGGLMVKVLTQNTRDLRFKSQSLHILLAGYMCSICSLTLRTAFFADGVCVSQRWCAGLIIKALTECERSLLWSPATSHFFRLVTLLCVVFASLMDLII